MRVHASPYQRGLTAVLQQQLAATGLKGVRISNAMMELRCIANHPLIRLTLAFQSLCLDVAQHDSRRYMRNQSCLSHTALLWLARSRLHCEDAESLLPPHELPPEVRLSGKLELLDRMLPKLHKAGHKVGCGAAMAQHPDLKDWPAGRRVLMSILELQGNACPSAPMPSSVPMRNDDEYLLLSQVLLFSTMTGALDVVGAFLSWRGFEHLQLDGRTRPADRCGIVHRFNTTGQTSGFSSTALTGTDTTHADTNLPLPLRRGVCLVAQRARCQICAQLSP